MLLSTGEQIAIALMAMATQTLCERAIGFTGAQVETFTDSTHRMRQALSDGHIVVVGFQGIDKNWNITKLI